MKLFIQICVAYLLCVNTSIYCSANDSNQGRIRLSEILLLLPPKTSNPVDAELKGYNGCFEWISHDSDLVEVTAVYNATAGCSTSATVRSVAEYVGRRSTIITAREAETGEEVKCKVDIDQITSIQVMHHSLELHVGNRGDLFIQAYDKEGNTFSTVEGLLFLWKIQSLEGADGTEESFPSTPFISQVPLQKSVFSSSSRRLELETGLPMPSGERDAESTYGSDVKIVQGDAVGRARVTAELVTNGKPSNTKASIVLIVMECVTMWPSPSPLRVLPGTQLPFQLLKCGDNERLPPSSLSLYRWRVTNKTVASIDAHTGLLHALVIGITEVFVEDSRIGAGGDRAAVRVVNAEKIYLEISTRIQSTMEPTNGQQKMRTVTSSHEWPLVRERQYLLKVAAEDATGQEVLLTSGTVVITEFEHSLWTVNNVQHPLLVGLVDLHTLTTGAVTVAATLEWADPSGGDVVQHRLQVSHVIQVCDPVEVQSVPSDTALRLPYLEERHQRHPLQAYGGCHAGPEPAYTFLSTDDSVISVGTLGMAEALAPGGASVSVLAALDLFPGHNALTFAAEVTTPAIATRNGPIEVDVEVGRQTLLEMILVNAADERYHNCSAAMEVTEWEQYHSGHGLALLPGGGGGWGVCAAASVEGSASPGSVRVTATLRNVMHAAATLHTHWTVSVYEALRAVPVDCRTVRAGRVVPLQQRAMARNRQDQVLLADPGSHICIALVGGPGTLQAAETSFVDTVQVTKEAGGALEGSEDLYGVPLNAKRHFRLECAAVGTGRYKVHFTSAVEEGLATAATTLRVHCEFPHSLQLSLWHHADAEAVATNGANATACLPTAGCHRLNGICCQPREALANHGAAQPVQAQRGDRLAVLTVAMDADGRMFTNASRSQVRLWLETPAQDAVLSEGGGGTAALAWREWFGVDEEWWGVRELTSARGTTKVKVMASAEGSGAPLLLDELVVVFVDKLMLAPHEVLLYALEKTSAQVRVCGGTAQLFLTPLQGEATALVAANLGPTRSKLPQLLLSVASDITAPSERFAPQSAHFSVLDRITGGAAPGVVKVAGAARVQLLLAGAAPVVLPLGAQLEVEVQVISQSGEVFPADQVLLMRPDIALLDSRLVLSSELQLVAKHDAEPAVCEPAEPARRAVLMVSGVVPGMSELRVSVAVHGGSAATRVLSEAAQVLVFAPLQLLPQELRLAPGQDYSIDWVGGPSQIRGSLGVAFVSSDPRVLEVHPESGCARALRPGSATVHATARGSYNEDYGAANTSVTVSRLSKIRISSPEQLRAGESVFVAVVGGHEREEAMAFGLVCADYRWSVDKPEVLQLRSAPPSALPVEALEGGETNIDTCGSGRLDEGFAMLVHGKAGGTAVLTASAMCAGQRFSSTATIRVLPGEALSCVTGCKWLLPPGFTTSPALPPNRKYTPMVANPEDKAAITLDAEGRLHAQDLPAAVCFMEDGEPVACAQVSPITMVRLAQSDGVCDSSEAVEASLRVHLRPGASALMCVILQNHKGELFGHARRHCPGPKVVASLTVESNHHPVVRAEVEESGQVRLVAARAGQALVRVHTNGAQPGYIHVAVGDKAPLQFGGSGTGLGAVWPAKPKVAVGGTVAFTLTGPGMQATKEEGVWFCSDERVMRVDELTGHAHALMDGRASVGFQRSSDGLTVETSVRVVTVAKAKLVVPPHVAFLTNVRDSDPPRAAANRGAQYSFPLTLLDAQGQELRDGLDDGVEHRLGFDCQLLPGYMGTARAVVLDEHANACEVTLRGIKDGAAEAARAGALAGFPPKTVQVVGKVTNAVETLTTLRFEGGMALAADTPATVELTPESNSSEVVVLGSVSGIQLSWEPSHPALDALTVTGPIAVPYTTPPQFAYHLQLPRGAAFPRDLNAALVFANPMTGQRIALPVHFSQRIALPVHFSQGATLSGTTWLVLVTLLAAVLINAFLCTYASHRSTPAPSTPAPSETGPSSTPSSNTPASVLAVREAQGRDLALSERSAFSVPGSGSHLRSASPVPYHFSPTMPSSSQPGVPHTVAPHVRGSHSPAFTPSPTGTRNRFGQYPTGGFGSPTSIIGPHGGRDPRQTN
ncbi:hypothetical protein CYMTET_38475 [Cymbomonas tetramitiformis]|uniref:Nuclear pore membrane glycoprotein 210 n=1 Tax=Cymbomonas tetramitiformis TaxID=36881 RepID=A0AAE0F584_9CHLO|nr:hypothetical protein CYMTET_38475 [Cymbomonas tetramitiformis]